MDLTKSKCKPCEGGVPKLEAVEIEKYLPQIHADWKVVDNHHIQRSFAFVNFKQTMDIVNKIAHLAEEEGHHPLMHVSYATLDIDLWTHAIDGLSENDFILAAKIDQL